MFLEKALQALGVAAQHPLALGMYVLVIVSWLVISLRVKRHRALLRRLDALPEKDRLKALELEIGPLPKKGINAEQWLRAREQVFKLARLGILCVAAIIILSLAVFYFLQAAPKSVVVAGQVTLDNRPLENATITVVGVAGEWTTDRNGAFHFQIADLLKSDSLTLTVVDTTGYEAVRLDTTVAKNAAAALLLKLTAPSTHFIAGRVLEEGTGNFIAGAEIVLEGNRGSGTTDARGYFRFAARGKRFEAVKAIFSHPNYQTSRRGLTISEDNQISLGRKP